MLNITYRERKTNMWVREKTKVTDVIEQVRRRKWTWARHVSRIQDNRWTLCITTWKPYERKRPNGRPARRWRDDLDKYWNGTTWQRKPGRCGSSTSRPTTGHYGCTMMMMMIVDMTFIVLYISFYGGFILRAHD